VNERPDFQGAAAVPPAAGRTAPPVGPQSADQQPATKADLYAAVDALRADMRELLDQVRTLIQDTSHGVDSRPTDDGRAGRPTGQQRPDDW